MAHPSGGYRLNGKRIPGTTTIIGRFKDSGGLINWAYAQGREHESLVAQGKPAPSHLYDTVEKAADIGTTVHSMVEAHINGEDKRAINAIVRDAYQGEDREACWSGFDAYLKWERMTHLDIVDQEMQLISPDYQFGGTPDAIGVIDNELCLVDWKTSNSVYQDYLIQLAAYKHLIEEGIRMDSGKPMDMELTGGFHLCRFAKTHGDFAHHYYPNLDDAWEAFKHMRALYDIDKELKARTK